MAKLTAGWFTSRWYPDRWWQTSNQFWTEYGADVDEPSPAAPSAQIVSGGYPHKPPRFPLTLGMNLEGDLVWVVPIQLKKENKN